MEDQQPLFGEKKETNEIILWVFGVSISIFTAYCLAIVVIFGLSHYYHFILGVVAILLYIMLAITFFWYRRSNDFDPKFKYFIIFIAVTLIVCGISINFYVFQPEPPPPIPCSGIYDFATKQCMNTTCPTNQCLDTSSFTCLWRNTTCPNKTSSAGFS